MLYNQVVQLTGAYHSCLAIQMIDSNTNHQ